MKDELCITAIYQRHGVFLDKIDVNAPFSKALKHDAVIYEFPDVHGFFSFPAQMRF